MRVVRAMLPERSCIMSILSFCFALEEKAAAKGKKERERGRSERETCRKRETNSERISETEREREKREEENQLTTCFSSLHAGCPAVRHKP